MTFLRHKLRPFKIYRRFGIFYKKCVGYKRIMARKGNNKKRIMARNGLGYFRNFRKSHPIYITFIRLYRLSHQLMPTARSINKPMLIDLA
jgi:hypothetical protein